MATKTVAVSANLRAMRPLWIFRQLMPDNKGWIQLSSVSASELIVWTHITSDGGFDITHASSNSTVTQSEVNLAIGTVDGSIFVRRRKPNGGFTFDGACRPAEVLF